MTSLNVSTGIRSKTRDTSLVKNMLNPYFMLSPNQKLESSRAIVMMAIIAKIMMAYNLLYWTFFSIRGDKVIYFYLGYRFIDMKAKKVIMEYKRKKGKLTTSNRSTRCRCFRQNLAGLAEGGSVGLIH